LTSLGKPNTPHPSVKGLRSTLAGITINVFLAAAKGITGFLGNSYALIADAIESSTDIFSSLIVWGGLKISAKPPDKDHPYGHGKAEPIAAILVSLALFAASVLIVIQSIHEIITPHHAPAPFTLIVLIIVVVVKEMLYRFVFRVGNDIKSTAVVSDAWHHRSDAITSAAVFVGISIALIGGKGFESADDYAALFASVIISFNAYRIFKPAFDEIMDTAPHESIKEQILNTALDVNGVVGLDKCNVRKMGLDFYVDLHVVVDANISVKEGHFIAHEVKDFIISKFPSIHDVFIHIEPEGRETLKKTCNS
jgi:cation diffusion facilitator family transporter